MRPKDLLTFKFFFGLFLGAAIVLGVWSPWTEDPLFYKDSRLKAQTEYCGQISRLFRVMTEDIKNTSFYNQYVREHMIKGNYFICTNDCGSTWYIKQDISFKEVLKEARAAGWQFVLCQGGVWEHYCPGCKNVLGEIPF